jgi:hypothetical protein
VDGRDRGLIIWRLRTPPTSVSSSDVFPPEEYGTGARLTPLVDAPAWVKTKARAETGRRAVLSDVPAEGDRVTLTPDDKAFLESAPSYEERLSLIASLAPPPMPTPSMTRRIFSMLLFVIIAGGACAILGMAVLRMLGKLVLP